MGTRANRDRLAKLILPVLCSSRPPRVTKACAFLIFVINAQNLAAVPVIDND